MWIERRADWKPDEEGLTSVEAWGNLKKFRDQLEGKKEVTDKEWEEARRMAVDTKKGESRRGVRGARVA